MTRKKREDPVYAATRAELEREGLPVHGRVIPENPNDEVYQATLAEVQRNERQGP